MGAGAVGGYYGARLAMAGHDVSFLVRSAHSAATLRSGLRVTSELGDVRLSPVNVVTDPQQTGPVDLVIVAVKLWDTDAAARSTMPMIGAGTSVISLQNGVDKDEMIAGVLGREHLLGAVTYIVVNRDQGGTIVHSGSLQRIIVGELDTPQTARVQEIVTALTAGDIDATASPDIRRSTWEKFIFLASISAVTAVTRETIGTVRSHPATRALLKDAMLEAASLARTEGVSVPTNFVDESIRFVDTLPAVARSSMAQDLLRGSRLELEWLSGAVVRRGDRIGLSTPVHSTLYAALAPFAGGRLSAVNQNTSAKD